MTGPQPDQGVERVLVLGEDAEVLVPGLLEQAADPEEAVGGQVVEPGEGEGA